MGKKLDALLGKSFRTSKFKAMVNLAISRLAVLRNQRQGRCSIAKSDVVDFLKAGNHDRALFRVEQVIKEQNMLDAFGLLESYCQLLLERVNLMEQEKVCPEELREAVSSLIYASTRCGEFPELQEIRVIFTSRFGKEFANRAVELRNNCGVNPKIIQKLSTRMPSLETKMKVLKEIASDNNIVLQIEEPPLAPPVADNQQNPIPSAESEPGETKPIHVEEEIERVEDISGGLGQMRRRKYKDVADAAQQAFESAAYAAAAARAAVELSRSESTDPDDPTNPSFRPRVVPTTVVPKETKLHSHEDENLVKDDQHIKTQAEFEKVHPIQKENENEIEIKRSLSVSSSESDEGEVKPSAKNTVFDESEGEDEEKSEENRRHIVEPLNIDRRPMSVRTRWTQGPVTKI